MEPMVPSPATRSIDRAVEGRSSVQPRAPVATAVMILAEIDSFPPLAAARSNSICVLRFAGQTAAAAYASKRMRVPRVQSSRGSADAYCGTKVELNAEIADWT